MNRPAFAPPSPGPAPEEIPLLRRRYPHTLRIVDRINRGWCRFWYRFRREGPCTLPASGPAIIAANHTCAADPLMISAGCDYRPISYMIAKEFANIPVGRWFVRLIECIPVERNARDVGATKAALRHLREGKVLAIFIEGRIPRPGEVVEPKHGIAVLALRSGAPVIPVHLSGNKYRESILGGLLARHRTRVRYGPPVDLGTPDNRPEIPEATARIAAAIRALAPETAVNNNTNNV
jgi:1-acyl-sn-glycerol-3-phosphate acyltransferase